MINDHDGFLVPSWWVREEVDEVDRDFSNVLFGFALAAAVFTSTRAGKQTMTTWKRSRRLTIYVTMIWLEWLSSVALAVIAWGFLMDIIPASLWFFMAIVLLWSIQVQLLLQIILNRLALLIVVRGRAKKIQWTVGLIIAIINISVFLIWVPARLEINQTYIAINEVWDRLEKVIFALVDIVLNLYFIYLTRSRLINNGLTKYTRLFQVNLGMIAVSLSLDIILIGTMSMRSSLVYLQFHPVAYLAKLSIEMNMADLIVKVVKATNPHAHVDGSYSTEGVSHGTKKTLTNNPTNGRSKAATMATQHNSRTQALSVFDEDIELGKIKRTTETRVVFEDHQEDSESRTSSTKDLTYPYA